MKRKLSANEILNALPSKYYVINLSSKEVLQTNDPGISEDNKICHKLIFNKELPCEISDGKCICQQFVENGKRNNCFIEKWNSGEKELYKAKVSVLDSEFIVASFENISEIVHVKKELKINSKRLERAEKLTDFGYWEFNIDNKIMIASKGAKNIYGVNSSNLTLEEIQSFPLKKYRKNLNNQLSELISNGKPYNVKFEIKRKIDREIRCIHSIAEYREDKRMVFGVIHDITENQKINNSLIESENNLKQLFKNMNSAFAYHKIITNKKKEPIDYIFLDVNTKFEDLTGLKRNDIINRSVLEVLPKTEKLWIEKCGKVALTGKPIAFKEYSGEIGKHFEIAAYSPKKNYFAVTFSDITASKKAEEEIENSNKLLRTVIDIIPDAIYMKDKNCRKLIANKADAVNCGFDNVDEIVGKTDFDLYPEVVANAYIKDDLRVIKNGESIINELEILPRPDKDRVILTSKFSLKNDKNEIIGLVGIGRDITKLKEHELRLQLLQQTVEQIPVAIIITNTDGIIEYVNPGFTKTTGYDFNEIVGKNPSLLKSGLHSDAFYKKLWETINSGENWYGEFQNRKKDGTLYWESAIIAPILNEKGEIENFVAIKKDISREKQMIEDLEISKEKAEESDRLKTIFLTNMSHEIRTPLNGILGFTNIICSGNTDKNKLEQYGSIIEQSGQRLIRVVDDIIDISMIQSNQMNFEFSKFGLNDLLNELFDSYKNLNERKLQGVDFKVVLCKNKKWEMIYSDKIKLMQVLQNLLDNAFKFTKTGSVKFGFSELSNKNLILFVKDTGIGISDNKTKVIFEAFRQAEEGDSRKFEGSGLGLAISAAIMKKLGGEIKVESKIGEGSVFYLNFYS